MLNKQRNWINTDLALIAAEGLAVLALLSIRRVPDQGLFLGTGFSLKNILLLGFVLLSTASMVFLLIHLNRKSERIEGLISRVKDPRWRIPTLVILLLIITENIQNILFIRGGFFQKEYYYREYLDFLESLLPLMVWALLAGVQTLIVVFALSKGAPKRKPQKGDVLRWGSFFLALMAAWLLIGMTNFGFMTGSGVEFVRTVGKFLPLVKPLPGFQVSISILLVLLLSGLMSWLENALPEKIYKLIKTAGPIILIWLVAVIAWSSVRIEPNFMIDIPPGFEDRIYPSSDAFYFDKEANRFILGKGFTADSTHVFYSFFLSMLHLMVGENYPANIFLQIVILALVPALVYLIAREFKEDQAGLLAALLLIFRERNGLLLGSELAGPLVNEYLSENLSLVFLLGFIYFLIKWLRAPDDRRVEPWIAGAMMGISLLIRAEFLAVLLSVAGVLGIIILRGRKELTHGLLKLLAVTCLIVIPWMGRNYQVSGSFYLDKGTFISRRVEVYLDRIFHRSPVVSDEEVTPSSEPDSGNNRLNAFFNHIGNNFHQSYLFLPNNHLPSYVLGSFLVTDYFDLPDLQELGLTERYLNIYVNSSPYYWYGWTGRINVVSLLPIGFALALISIGLNRFWKKDSLALFLLGTMFASHILIWSFASYSGSRMVKAIDWMPLLLYSVGLCALIKWLWESAGYAGDPAGADLVQELPDPGSKGFGKRSFPAASVLLLVVLILAGLGPTLLENMVPEKYTQADLDLILNEKNSQLVFQDLDDCLDIPASAGKRIIAYGQAYYPRYFEKDQMYPDVRKGTIPEPYGSRVDFYLIGTGISWVSLPALGADSVFPDTAEVLVVGQEIENTYHDKGNGTYLRADCVYVTSLPGSDLEPLYIPCQGDYCPLVDGNP